MQPCALIGLRRRAELFNRAGVPTRYHDATLSGYEDRGGNQSLVRTRFASLHHEVEHKVQPGGRLPRALRGIGLAGPPGTGKTHLMAAMARHLVLNLGVAVRFTDFARLLWDLKAGFDAGQGEDALIAPLVEVEVLFIDELGKGRASEWEIGILDALVSERYNRKLMTFFATNHPLAEQTPGRSLNEAYDRKKSGAAGVDGRFDSLASRTHPRIVSRLSEMCELLTIEGPDSRLAAPVARVAAKR
jgi:DNA replication protein DnaC